MYYLLILEYFQFICLNSLFHLKPTFFSISKFLLNCYKQLLIVIIVIITFNFMFKNIRMVLIALLIIIIIIIVILNNLLV